jgi:hypothetical protein
VGIDGVVISVEPPVDRDGADALLHRGVTAVARLAAASDVQVVLVSQIYVTRAREHPEMAAIITARVRGEQALRESGAPLHDRAAELAHRPPRRRGAP